MIVLPSPETASTAPPSRRRALGAGDAARTPSARRDVAALQRALQGFSDPAAVGEAATVDGVVDPGLFAAELERQADAAERWQRNLLIVAGRFGVEPARTLAELGPAGADLVETAARADLVEATAAVRRHCHSTELDRLGG